MPVPRSRAEGVKEASTSKNDQSFNASTIISSLVEANKSKLASGNILASKLAKRPEKFEEFRSFPNKINSSIYEAPPTAKNKSETKAEGSSILTTSEGGSKKEP